MPVVLLHAQFARVDGGFVGVDVFFVISGFLITQIILHEAARDSFTLTGFYRRRIARIGPALWAMLAAVMIAGVWLLLPSDWPELSVSAMWAAGFGANLFFWRELDYFAFHEVALLLHTWSLGVEEQFYLFYPLLLGAILRFSPGRIRTSLWMLTIGSFGLGLVLAVREPQAGFYLLPSRAWELSMGGLLAVGAAPRIGSQAFEAALALLGLGMIAASVYLLDNGNLFPAPWALLPCIGTCLVIAYGRSGPAFAFLSFAPVRWIGRISYSTYLWHWPIIVFYRLEYGLFQDRWTKAGLVLASLAAGAISYYAIELPAMRTLRQKRPGLVFALAGVAIAGIFAMAFTGKSGNEAINQSEAAQSAAYLASQADQRRSEQFRLHQCFGTEIELDECLVPVPDRIDVAVTGDSYAAQLWRAISENAGQKRVHQVTVLRCLPVVGTTGPSACTTTYDAVFEQARAGRIQELVLAARWHATDAPKIAKTITALKAAGVKVTVVGPPVEYDQSFPRLLAVAERRGDSAHIERLRRSERDAIDPVLARSVKAAGGRYISHLEFECPQGRCRWYDSRGLPIHFDTGHLTLFAAREFARSHAPW